MDDTNRFGKLTKIVALLGFTGVTVLLVWLAWSRSLPPNQKEQMICLTIGLLLGGVTGALVSPKDASLPPRISTPAKLALLFVTGYFLAKIDPLLSLAYEPGFWNDSTRVISVGLLCTAFVATAVVSYVFSEFAHSSSSTLRRFHSQLTEDDLLELEDSESYGEFFTAGDHAQEKEERFEWLPN